MADSLIRRRDHGEDAIYFDAAKNRFVGAISLGFGPDGKRIRRKVTGRTKAEVRDKLKTAHAELDRGLHTSATYTVQHAVDDWLDLAAQVPVALAADLGVRRLSSVSRARDASAVSSARRILTSSAAK